MADELWPSPSAAVEKLIRQVAEHLAPETRALAEALAEASLRGLNEPGVASDPALTQADLHANHLDVMQWLTSNLHRPGRRVEPYLDTAALDYARDLMRRGMSPDYAGAWRAAQVVAWRRWVSECVTRTDDPAVLTDVLDISAQSFAQFAVDSIRALDVAMAREADELITGAETRRLATIDLILEGAPITLDLAEAQLGYRLSGHHTAAVIWADVSSNEFHLDSAVKAVTRAAHTRSALVVKASAATRWVWMTTDDSLPFESLLKAIGGIEDVQLALGGTASGMDGFRRTHADAVAAQRVLVRLAAPRRVTRYADLRLVDLLTSDAARAEAFVVDTLGDLAAADASLRRALLSYIQSGFNASKIAAELYVHRNTVERWLTRANGMLATKVEEAPVEVAAALMMLALRDPA